MTAPVYVLGVNCAYHESSACLLRDGQMVAAVEEERFIRVKHAKHPTVHNPHELPWHAILYCLSAAGIDLADVQHVGFSLNPYRRLENARLPDRVVEGDWGSVSGEQAFFERVRRVPTLLQEGGFTGAFHWLDHHLCHAASAFFPSPFTEAAVLTVDGIGETATAAFAHGVGDTVRIFREVTYPASLGFLWEKLSVFLGFAPDDAAKVMGLAAYGDASVLAGRLRDAVRLAENGTFRMDSDVFRFRVEEYGPLEALLGVRRRQPGEELTRTHEHVAAALQAVTNDLMLHMVSGLHAATGSADLCLAGGVALNCISNRLLFEAGPFERLYVQPAAHDAGTAIGAAAAVWHMTLHRADRHELRHAYLGPGFSADDVARALEGSGLPHERPGDLEARVARLLRNGAIVGWFRGAMEVGPRALGNRSLLADPRAPGMREVMNRKVKHREPFRPFAPSVLDEEAGKWFVMAKPAIAAEFMLMAYPARPEVRHLIPAVVHVDGTSRIHAVRQDVNPSYHRLITEFFGLTGIPMLLNTSFNDDEPIVCAPADAIMTFLKTDIDYLAIEDLLVWKPGRQGPALP